MDTDPTWFTGQLLLALPGIGDPRFEHSVIAMISHDEDGAMGIGVGEPINGMTVGAVLDQLEIDHEEPLDQPVFLGGPVEPSRGFVLHSRDWGGQEAVQVGDRWMVSSSHDILRAIGEGRGRAGWWRSAMRDGRRGSSRASWCAMVGTSPPAATACCSKRRPPNDGRRRLPKREWTPAC